jgi:hypothetical protein
VFSPNEIASLPLPIWDWISLYQNLPLRVYLLPVPQSAPL